MASCCDKFIPPAMTYGVGCAICGYPEKDHVKKKSSDGEIRRKPEHRPAQRSEKKKKATTQRTSKQHTVDKKISLSEEYESKRADDPMLTDRSVASEASVDDETVVSFRSAQASQTSGRIGASRTRTARSKQGNELAESAGRTIERRGLMESIGITGRNPRAPRPSQSEAIKGILDKQANLLALAGDAARHNGDTASAQTFYEESADAMMDKLRLDLSKIKTSSKPRHPETKKHERSKRREYDSGQSTARSDVTTEHTDRSDRSEMRQTAWAGAVSGDRSHTASYKETGKRGYLDVSDSKKKTTTSMSQSALSQTETLFQHANYGSEKRQKLTELFYLFSNGAPALTVDAFGELINYVRCPGDLDSYFCAFDRSKRKSWIDLTDFLLGCAAMDPATRHSGVWRTERSKYIFRYYADNGVEMSRDRFNDLIDHIVTITQETPWKLIEGAERVFAGQSTMTFRNFNNACSNLTCLSQLFRYRITRGLKIVP